MSDLISRQDALKPFCIAPDGIRIPEVDCDNFPVEFSVAFIKKHLLSLPSAEPPYQYSQAYVEQIRTERDYLQDMVNEMASHKTGEWIKATGMMPPEFHGHHCCSECGNFANMEPPFGNREDLSKFCPNCGAYMVNHLSVYER